MLLFPTTDDPGDFHLNLLFTTNETGTLIIRGLDGHVCVTYTYIAGSKEIEVPESLQINKQTVENKGIHVVTSHSITLHAVSHNPSAVDEYLVLPVTKLSTAYIVPPIDNAEIGSTFIGVTGTQDDTTVQLRLRSNSSFFLNGTQYKNGDVITVHLNAYQAIQISHVGDIAGGIITSDHPIAVQTGSQCPSVAVVTGTCNHKQDMLTPLGSYYFVPPVINTQKYIVRVTTVFPNTEIEVNNPAMSGVSTVLLKNAGDTKNIVITGSALMTSINSTQPFLAVF